VRVMREEADFADTAGAAFSFFFFSSAIAVALFWFREKSGGPMSASWEDLSQRVAIV
jgi:uncharacterized membrane protein YeiB